MGSANGFQPAQSAAGVSVQDTFHAADRAMRAKDFKQASALCQQILQTNETFAPAYFMLAQITMELYQHDKALKFNELAEKFQSGSFDIYFQRGQICFVLGKMEDALTAFEHAQSLQPSNAITAMLIGDVLAQLGRLDEAISQFTKATMLQDLPQILEHKGICQQQVGDLEGAKTSFQSLLQRDPNHAGALMYLGKLAMHDQDEAQAERYFRQALAINPNHQETLLAVASICLARHEMQEAVALSRRAIAVNPNHPNRVIAALQALLSAGFLDEVEQILRHLYQHHPDNVGVLIRLATILAPRGKTEEALMLIEKIIEKYPDNVSLLHTRAALRGETTATAPESYVANTFDSYAEQFDYHLQELLGYHTPRLIADAVRDALPTGSAGLSLLDLGCGTGLAAEALADITALRVGVDLSPKMIAKAQAKGIYSEAHVDELVRYMNADSRHYDLVVAADVLVYIGDLEPLFASVNARLKTGGLFALSVEREESQSNYVLRPSGRYAHSQAYVQMLATTHGFDAVHCAACDLRKEAEHMIVGTVCVLKKTA